MSQRRLARIMALQVLSEWDFNKSLLSKNVNIQEITQRNFKEFSFSDFKEKLFLKQLVQNILKNIKKIDLSIVKYAPQWPIKKITLIDRNILRIGVFELLISCETPPKVIINEAIEIAKSFGSETSGKFINGVLGAIYEKIKNSGQNSKLKQK